MDKDNIQSVIDNLARWKRNRDKCSERRTHGSALDSEPLTQAIELLKEFQNAFELGRDSFKQEVIDALKEINEKTN